MKNPVIIEKEQKMKEEKKLIKEREALRKKRDEKIKSQIQKKQEEKKKMLEETKDERKKKREEKKKKQLDLKGKRESEKQERQKEYQEKKQEEMEELAKKQEAEEAREKAKKDQFEKDNKVFLKEQAKKIRKEFNQINNEKKSLQQAEKEYEEMSQKLREDMKKKMEKHFEENKDNLKKDKEEKVAINKFMKNKAVVNVFDSYDAQLKYFFDFYAKSTYHELRRDIEDDFETMNYKEFIKFAYESNIIPTVMPIREIIYIFYQLVRERQDQDPKALQVLDYEYFKKAIVRISTVGQELLGGQNGPKFEKKTEEWDAKAEKDKNAKNKLTKKFSNMPDMSMKKKNKTEPVKKENDKSDDEEVDNKKDLKKLPKDQRIEMRREGTLVERGAKPRREKVVLPSAKEEKLKSATLMKGKMDPSMMMTKNSSNINKLIELDEQSRAISNLKNVKIEDHRVTTECDVSIISDKTVEALLKFIGLDPVDVDGEKPKFNQELRFKMDEKLNNRKLDVQGAKPNKFRKSQVPEKADVLDKFEDVSEGEEAEGDESGDDKAEQRKKDKAKKEEKDDKEDDKDNDKDKDKDKDKNKK